MFLLSVVLSVAIACAWYVFGERVTELMAPARQPGRRRTMMPLSFGGEWSQPEASNRTWAASSKETRTPITASVFEAPEEPRKNR